VVEARMDYELAKELKEAGYPIKKQLITRYNRDIAVPTLEELIEACGPKFMTLRLRHDSQWEVNGEIICRTPIEAVARLWLALHSK
jgi:hypothetical protein